MSIEIEPSDYTYYYNLTTKCYISIKSTEAPPSKDFIPFKRIISHPFRDYLDFYNNRLKKELYVNSCGIAVPSIGHEDTQGIAYAPPVKVILAGNTLDVTYYTQSGQNKIYLSAIPRTWRRQNDTGDALDFIKKLSKNKDLKFVDYGNSDKLKDFFANLSNSYPEDKYALDFLPFVYSKCSLGCFDYDVSKDYF